MVAAATATADNMLCDKHRSSSVRHKKNDVISTTSTAFTIEDAPPDLSLLRISSIDSARSSTSHSTIESNGSSFTTTTTNMTTTNMTTTTTTTTTINHHHHHKTFDYIIVGGGTSAMGLLHGLLAANAEEYCGEYGCLSTRTTVRIAVLERGNLVSSQPTCFSSSSSVKPQQQQPQHPLKSSPDIMTSSATSRMIDPCVRPLHRWCAASFPPERRPHQNCQVHEAHLYHRRHHHNDDDYDDDDDTSAATEWCRLLDLSTGYGLGGTTLINAGLVIPPSLEHDFVDWPSTITTQISHSLSTMTHIMYRQQCIHPSTKVAATSSSSTTAKKDHQPSLKETTNNTIFPSTCWYVPCAVTNPSNHNNTAPNRSGSRHESHPSSHQNTSSPTLQRVSYYESLVEPLLQQQQSSNHAKTNRMDVTILTGYQVERLFIQDDDLDDNLDGVGDITTKSCTGVEVYHTATGTHHTYTATTEVILCTGTIISPVLLLNAGIGRQPSKSGEDCTDHVSNCTRNQHTGPHTRTTTSQKQKQRHQIMEADRASVGCRLLDHVMLPRAILTRPDFTPCALNGVRAIRNVWLHHNNSEHKRDDTKNHKTKSNHYDNNIFSTKTQICLMDSAAYWDLIPIMGAAVFRYQLHVKNGREVGKMYMWTVQLINLLLHVQYRAILLLLYLLIHYSPLYYFTKHCIKVIAIFVMNGESHGSLTVSPKCNDEGAEATVGSRRICDVNIHINLGYLSHPNDRQRFREAFEASLNVFQPSKTFEPICELFPGPLVWNYPTYPEMFHHQRFDFMAQSMVLPYFHWMGTCAMKQKVTRTTNNGFESQHVNDDDDDDWVVDEHFRVRGVQNLRVCDASIFPRLISAPPALTCAALGHVLAKMILVEISKNENDTEKLKKSQ